MSSNGNGNNFQETLGDLAELLLGGRCEDCVLRFSCSGARAVLPDNASELEQDLYAAGILQLAMIEALREDIRNSTHDAEMLVGAIIAVAEGGDGRKFTRAALWLVNEVQRGDYEYRHPLLPSLAVAWALSSEARSQANLDESGILSKIFEAVAYGKEGE